jgi:tRNA pseudouridine55 synthase
MGQVVEALDQFTGDIEQVPPMYSALKKDGKALYEYARQGETIERAARRVRIHSIELISADLSAETPSLSLRVACSKGTYIRTLGEDIGEHLGCGGHLTRLRRVMTGSFAIERCITIEKLEAMSDDERMKCLHPVDILMADDPAVELEPSEAGRFLSGLRRRGTWADQPRVRVYGRSPRALLGAGHIQSGELIPDRLLSPIEIEQFLKQ